MNKKEGTPCKCGNKYIENRTHWLCSDCNFIRIHGVSRREYLNNKQIDRKETAKPMLKKSPIKNKRKKTGERELFLEIWQERQHFCVNCNEYLGDEPMAYFFSHKISKGADCTKRLDKDNIELLCFDCHYAIEFQGKEKFKSREKI